MIDIIYTVIKKIVRQEENLPLPLHPKSKTTFQLMATKTFHRYQPSKGYALYWILLAYLVIGYFYPIIGLLAIVCMIAPVAFAVRRGRWWCGNACPRGNFYDRLLAKYSPHRPIPALFGRKASVPSWCSLFSRCLACKCTSLGAIGPQWARYFGTLSSSRPL